MLKLTRKDICGALQVPEHRMRSWMTLLPFSSRSTSARKAREFDAGDLMLLALTQILEDKFKLRKEGLDNLLPALEDFLRRPMQNNNADLIFIDVQNWSVEYASTDAYYRPGFVVDLASEQERVARFLGLAPAQTELPLGLQPLRKTKG